MKIIEHDPKETFGLVYKVYPFLEENDDDAPGWAFSYSVFEDGRLEIFGQVIPVDVAKNYLSGLAKAIYLASGGDE